MRRPPLPVTLASIIPGHRLDLKKRSGVKPRKIWFTVVERRVVAVEPATVVAQAAEDFHPSSALVDVEIPAGFGQCFLKSTDSVGEPCQQRPVVTCSEIIEFGLIVPFQGGKLLRKGVGAGTVQIQTLVSFLANLP